MLGIIPSLLWTGALRIKLTVDQKLLFNLSFVTKLRVKKSLPIVSEFAVESISHQNIEAKERERRGFLAVSKVANSNSQSIHYLVHLYSVGKENRV